MENQNKSLIDRFKDVVFKLESVMKPNDEIKLEDEAVKVEETIEVKLVEVKMVDGSVIKYNEDMTGAVVVLVDAEGNTIEEPLKVGEYMLEDSKVLVVIEDGIVSEIKEVEKVDETVAMKEEQVQLSIELSKLNDVVSNLTSEIESLRAKKIELEAELITLSKTPIGKSIDTNPHIKKDDSNIKLTVAEKYAQIAKNNK